MSSRDRERGRYRDDHRSDRRNREADATRGRDQSREELRHRSRSRERKRERSRSASRGRANSPSDSREDKKKQRLAKLAAWKSKQAGAAAAKPEPKTPAENPAESKTLSEEPKAWMPWEDPTAAFTAAAPEPAPPPRLKPVELPSFVTDHGVDPLDAFMANEVDPEVQAKEVEEARKREEELRERAQQRADGKIPKLDKILEDSSDEEEVPDAEIQVPEHKVKLVVGPGGERIKHIQRKSKCRIQIKKSEEELKKGFLEKRSYALPKPRQAGDEIKPVTIMLFGNARECEVATRMIDEAIENREQKQKQREREYERKRDAKSRDRQLYHLRHTHDYETLGIPIGASKADAKKAFRELAKKWHPDKHPNDAEAAKIKFQTIQRAFESLMTSDEDARIEALAHT